MAIALEAIFATQLAQPQRFVRGTANRAHSVPLARPVQRHALPEHSAAPLVSARPAVDAARVTFVLQVQARLRKAYA